MVFFRDSLDDGVFTGLLLGPLITSAMLLNALRVSASNPTAEQLLPPGWMVEAPTKLPNGGPVIDSLILSRYNLVDLAIFCSAILMTHICSSWWLESRYSKRSEIREGERASVPRSEGQRAWNYGLFMLGVTFMMLAFKVWFVQQKFNVWKRMPSYLLSSFPHSDVHLTDMNYYEIGFAALFYQSQLYGAIRLAHRGFTLGELALVCFGGTALAMEFLGLTIARVHILLFFWLRRNLIVNSDMAYHHTVYPDIPPAYSAFNATSSSNRWLISDWLYAFPFPGVVQTYRTAARPSSSIPS
jgi:dolichol kinase